MVKEICQIAPADRCGTNVHIYFKGEKITATDVEDALALLNRYLAGDSSVSYRAGMAALRTVSAYARALDPGR